MNDEVSDATKEKAIKLIESMLRIRCKARGIEPTKKWLCDKAKEIFEEEEATHEHTRTRRDP